MGGPCGDRVKTIKTIFVAETFNFFGKKVLSAERFRIMGLFYTNYKMAISVQNPMLKVNYRVIINKCPKVNKSRANIKARENFLNAFK